MEQIDFVSPQTRLADSDRKELIELITKELLQNQHLRDNTYFTLMLIAFEKGRVQHLAFQAIPKIDEIIALIKNTHLRQDNPSSRNVASTFDIDFFFIVVEQFRKYHLLTKRIFLTHLHTFLKNHQPAFMSIFDEIQSVENNGNFKRKLLGFFFMIISDCITNPDREISRYAENILLEVCFFQLTANPFEFG